jgi:hypothetical protein
MGMEGASKQQAQAVQGCESAHLIQAAGERRASALEHEDELLVVVLPVDALPAPAVDHVVVRMQGEFPLARKHLHQLLEGDSPPVVVAHDDPPGIDRF